MTGKNFVATPRDRASHDALRLVASVDLGGVDEVDAKLERAGDDLGRVDLRVFGAVAPLLRSELPRAETDGRQAYPVYFDESHGAERNGGSSV
jgi:hypothetical protein